MRIGFLFNHDQIHQIGHSLPIAIALAEGGFDGEIIVATTNDLLADEVRRVAGPWLGAGITHMSLSLKAGSQRLSRVLGSIVPAAKLLMYRDNLDFFRSLNILVVAEKTSLLLKSRYGLKNLFIVHTRHGAGDRAIGFNRASAAFDHVLCSGEKIRRRLIADAGVNPDTISVIGYPKFDMVRQVGRTHHFERDRPVILYNPHPAPHLSSWYKHGRAVLDLFQRCPERELIFAPHIMLFERPFVLTIDKLRISRAGTIENRYLHGDNIHIDLGSRASTDMSYTMAADIYLGDASSQVYEFLVRPRPCIFFNSHAIDWQGNPNFAHWQAGEVIHSPADLEGALDRADALHANQYRSVQERLFADSFDLNGRPSSDRAAEVIAALAERRRNSAARPQAVQAA
ncbi:MAG: hypothetical protein PSY12_16705 [bacterium]|nr:hypothetical protein [bacterium]